MKTLKLIIASLIISFSVNAQKANVKKIEQKELLPEQKAKFQTEKMKSELNLSNEQYDKAYQINLGIVQKNQSLTSQGLTDAERDKAVALNHEARMAMLKNVLTAEQFTKMVEKIKQNKGIEKE